MPLSKWETWAIHLCPQFLQLLYGITVHRKLTGILWGSNKWPVTRLFRSSYFSQVHQHFAVSTLAMLSKLHFSSPMGSQLDYLSQPSLQAPLQEVINAIPSPDLLSPAWSSMMSFHSLESQMHRTQWRALDLRGFEATRQEHQFLNDYMKVSLL